MSALARYFNVRGCHVYGYDKTPTALTAKLQEEGINIHFNDDVNEVPEMTIEKALVVYTPAIPNDHAELNDLLERGFKVMKRSEVLGLISAQTDTVAVAGTHGKTTTSTMIAHILEHAAYKHNAFLGGIATNYETNVLLSENAQTTVVEADEYDRSFLTLYPKIAVVTSMDADHLDIYGNEGHLEESFRLFVSQIKPGGKLIHKKGLSLENGITYAIKEEADYYASSITIEGGTYMVDVVMPQGMIKNMALGLAGWHNVENAVAALAVARELGIGLDDIKSALGNFRGVKRRFEYHVKTEELIYIDDYAHHPEELRASIGSVRELYPGKKITGVFQPHLYSRTKDFASEFAASLEALDELILLEIYPAREEPIPGVSSSMLLHQVNLKNKWVFTKKELVEAMKDRELEVLLTLGAGDIDQLVEPIKEVLLNKLAAQP